MKPISEERSGAESHSRRRSLDLGRLFLAIIFITLGVVLLGRNAGWFNVNFQLDWGLIWPIIVIFFGLSLISGRGIVSYLIGVLLVTAIAILVVFGLVARPATAPGTNVTRQNVEIELGQNVTSTEIDLNVGAGTLTLTGDSNAVLAGVVESSFLTIDTSSEVVNSTQNVSLHERGSFSGTLGSKVNDLELKVGTVLPTDLRIDSGAMDMNLDLTNVMTESLTIKTGASSLDLTMGDKVVQSMVNIDAGVSSVDINLPRTVGVKVTLDAGLSSKNLEEFIKIDNNIYKTANYDTAERKIDVNLKIGVSSLNVKIK